MHGSSIGEVNCLMRLYRSMRSRERFRDSSFLLTYTSASAKEWLDLSSSESLPAHFHYDLRRVAAWLGPSRRHAICIVAEKERLRGLSRLFGPSRIINVDAKPPQSIGGKAFEWLNRAIPQIEYFSVENDAYRADIRARAPRADVSVTGTLKAPTGRTVTAAVSPPRLAFVSALAHEAKAISRLISKIREAVPSLTCVVVPRYVGDASLPWRRREHSERAFLAELCQPELIVTLADMEVRLASEEATTILFMGLGAVMDILPLMRVAVMGGTLHSTSFATSKGHNFFEPMASGVPTIVGTQVRNWRYSVSQFVEEGSLLSMPVELMSDRIVELLTDEQAYLHHRQRVLESRALRFHQSAAERIVVLIESACENMRPKVPQT